MKTSLITVLVLSALATACASGSSNASVNANASSFTPPENNTPMIVMHQGEEAFGGGSFTVSIYPDGKVHYEPRYTTSMNDVMSGNKPKSSPTPADWTITPEQVGSLLDAFANADFLDLKDRYQYVEDGCPTHAEDLPTIDLTLTLRDKSKKIVHSLGCMEVNSGPPYPKALRELEDRVKVVALNGHV